MRLTRTTHSLLRISLLLVIGMFLVCESVCQNISYVAHLEKKDGLADRIVHNISRDSNGYFYLYFDQSVQNYDGRNFKNISTLKMENLNSKFVPQFIYNPNNTTPIAILDNKPNESFYIQTNQLTPFMQSPLMESASPADSVFISGNKEQILLFRKTKGKYLVSIAGDQSRKTLFQLAEIKLPAKAYFDIHSNTLFLEYLNGAIHAYNINNQLIKTEQGKLILRKDDVILANKTGILVWETSTFNLLHPLKDNHHKCLWVKKDRMNNIMIAYHKDIARVVDLYILKSDNQIINYNNVLNHVVNIKDVFAEDFFQEILVASFNSLFVIKFQNPGLKLIYNLPLNTESSFGNVVTGIQSTKNKNLVFLTRETDGLHFYNKSAPEKVIKIKTTVDYTNSNSLIIDDQDSKLYSTRYNFQGTGDFNIYDIESSIQKQIPLDFSPSGISSIIGNKLFIFGSYRDKKHMNSQSDGTIWSFDIKTQKLARLAFPTKALRNNIKAFYYDVESSEYWLGSTNGLFRLDENLQIIQEYNNKRTDKKFNITIPHIRMIKKYDDYFFIGTKGDGLYIIDWKTKFIKEHKTSKDDLTDNNIIAMEKSLDNKYWIASFNGITTFNDTLKRINKLYDKDGLSNPEFNTAASHIDLNGTIYFGSINGLTAINSAKTLSSKEFTKINIESIKTYENGKTSILSLQNSPIKISENVDSFNLNYNIPQYFKHYYEEQKEFVEILNNHNQDLTIDNESIRVRNLKKGQFNIEIGQTNGENKSINLNFKIFKDYIPLLILLLSLASIIVIWYLFTTQKIRSNLHLEQEKTKFNKKLAELELTALRSQMNPHFIFNALGAIQYFINTKDIEKADDYLTKFAKLMRSILESSKSKYIRLQDEIDMLKLYVSLEHIRFEGKFTYEFDIDPETDTIDFKIPSMIIQPVIENAINHGLYHLNNRKGTLTISFIEKHEDHIICVINDNGIGRKAAAKLSSKKDHKSRGMEIVNERIHALKLNEEFDIKITTTDLNDESTGTNVEISIERKI